MSSSSTHLDLSASQGGLLIGIFFSVFLFGISTVQTWFYFQHYPKDRKTLKIMVGILWILELIHAVLACHSIYWYLALNFASPAALGTSIWLSLHFRFTCSSPGECGNIFVGFASCATSGLSFAAGTFANYPDSINATSTSALALSVFADLMIAFSISYFLRQGRTGFTNLLDLIVLVTAQAQNNLNFLAIFEVVASVYANSLLATLNIRAITRGQVLNEDGTSLELNSSDYTHSVGFEVTAPKTGVQNFSKTAIQSDGNSFFSVPGLQDTSTGKISDFHAALPE
ncbi:hypothetical protein EDD85DRAFT_968438 [Armillaria nabsnona]|nr:hypothetical protein EDD85DRAFT_968438 [Armillaria nabsnona]